MKKASVSVYNPDWNGVEINPCLAKTMLEGYGESNLYAIAHFDSAQTDSTPFGPDKNMSLSVDWENVDWDDTNSVVRSVPAGPVNIITLASTDENYMWQVGTDKVSYVKKDDWTIICQYEALNISSNDEFEIIPESNFHEFGLLAAEDLDGNTEEEKKNAMKAVLADYFNSNYSARFKNGLYPLVSSENTLYVKYGESIHAFEVDDVSAPGNIRDKYPAINPGEVIAGSPEMNNQVVGMSITYDGYLLVVFRTGLGIIDSQLKGNNDGGFHYFAEFNSGEGVSNSISVEKLTNGDSAIYVASSKDEASTGMDGYLRKIVWRNNGDTQGVFFLNDEGEGVEGHWTVNYATSTRLPPAIKAGNGTGSTPTLMGFDEGNDQLVVITDGSEKMNLLAFWRHDIPAMPGKNKSTSNNPRLAGEIAVTCGLGEQYEQREWIQSEQSVVVNGYGAFVVNNIPESASSDWFDTEQEKADLILQVSLVGPVYEGPKGIERFEWDIKTKSWLSVWSNPNAPATSMVPIYTDHSQLVIIGGYENSANYSGWQLTGYDWQVINSSEQPAVFSVHLDNRNYGNGAYSIPQFLDTNQLLFNSIVGPMLINLDNL